MSKKVLTPEQKAKKREYMREYMKRYKGKRQGVPAPASLAEQIRFKLNALNTQIQSLKQERGTILQDLHVILKDVEIQSDASLIEINTTPYEMAKF